MKRLLSVLLCIATAASACVAFTACDKQKDDASAAGADIEKVDVIDGGWSPAESPEVTDDLFALFEKAAVPDSVCVPVAYLESQVVAGTNHLALCKVTSGETPDGDETYALATLYEDPDGNAEVTSIIKSDLSAKYPEGDDIWMETASPALTDDAKSALDKACETLAGVEYTPVALLATMYRQISPGKVFRILCESRAAVPDAASEYVIIDVSASYPDGKAEISDTYGFDGAKAAEIANPVVEYGAMADSLEKAEDAVGFEIAYPESIVAENYVVINGELLEIDFEGGYIRKAKGADDVSGDYNGYASVYQKDICDISVTLKGDGDKVMLAVWTYGGHTYCIGITEGVSEAEMTSYVGAIK